MTDKTSRDIRLGDLSDIEPSSTQEPRLGDSSVSSTTRPVDRQGTGRRARVDPRMDSRVDAPIDVTSTRRVAEPPASRSTWPMVAMGVVVLGLLAVVVMLVSEQRKLSASLHALEAQSKASVQTLESRVASTSTTLKSADSETQRSLNVLGGDISSLNKTLSKLAEALTQEAQARTAVDTELKAVTAEMRKADQTATQSDTLRDARLKAISENLEQVNGRLKSVSEGLARLERSGDLSQLRSEVAVLGASIRQLEDDHDRRIKSVEQTTGSNDAFRRQVNSTIDRLNQQVTELYQRR
jgi:septal ring factor EnvC (AmiA/AmiB activator)